MAVERERVASCSCGHLRVTVRGEPDVVVLCHCVACQRRTGSPFGVGAYFRKETVTAIEGVSKTYTRKVDGADRALVNHFCVDCGTNVYWTADLRPGHIGVAVGCFAEPDFMPPTRIVWAQHSHPWVTLPAATPTFPQASS